MALVDNDYIIINQNINDLADNEYQFNDKQNKESIRCKKIIKYLKTLPKSEQKSFAWIRTRRNYLGGSEAGTIISANKYEPYYKIILKKVHEIPFLNFAATYVGNKYENTAKAVYEFITNTIVDEYGFVPHRTISFIGASPDGIVSEYKYDGIHKTNLVGKMIEIKCTVTRQINMDIDAEPLEVVPIYYYPQIQQQLETCDLNECDFWQVKPFEYNSRSEFEEDTSETCCFKSKDNKFKGCVIQILPIDKFKGINLKNPDKKILNEIYKNAKFIHPPKVNVSSKELYKWIHDVKHKIIPEDEKLKEYYEIKNGYAFHKVFYWRIEYGRCTNIKRDKEWFKKYYPIYKKTWDYISFLRNNYLQCQIFIKYVDYVEQNKYHITDEKNTVNKIIIDALDQLYTLPIDSLEVKELCDICNLTVDENNNIVINKTNQELEWDFPGFRSI